MELRAVDSATGRRQSERQRVAVEAALRSDDSHSHGSLCRIVDLSLHGARLETYGELRPDSRVALSLPHAIARTARIVWFHDFAAGCQFDVPLSDAELKLLVQP